MQDSDGARSFDDVVPEDDDPYYSDPHFDHEAQGKAQLETEIARYFLALPDPPDGGQAPDMSVDEMFEEAADSAGADRIAARARLLEPGPLTAQMLEVIKPSRLSPRACWTPPARRSGWHPGPRPRSTDTSRPLPAPALRSRSSNSSPMPVRPANHCIKLLHHSRSRLLAIVQAPTTTSRHRVQLYMEILNHRLRSR